MGIVTLEKLTTSESLESAISKAATELGYKLQISKKSKEKSDKEYSYARFNLNQNLFTNLFTKMPPVAIAVYGNGPYRFLEVYPGKGKSTIKYLDLIFKYLDLKEIK